MRKIEYSRGALRKLESIHQYISETLKSPNAAAKVVESIIRQVSFLKESPMIGPGLSSRIDSIPDRFSNTRFLVCDKHIVIYEIKKTKIQILAIYHTTEDVFGRVLHELDR